MQILKKVVPVEDPNGKRYKFWAKNDVLTLKIEIGKNVFKISPTGTYSEREPLT